MKLYVSLTTIPSRINTIGTSIVSILNQTVRVDKIFLNIPRKYDRFPDQIIDDNKLNELADKFGDVLQINRLEEDCGPGTKLIGVPSSVFNEDGFLILIDDDMEYKSDGIEKLFGQIVMDGLYSYYVYKSNGITIAQGADMMAMPLHLMKHMHRYYEIIKQFRTLKMMDDMWISYYFFKMGYPVVHAHRNDLVYNIVTEVDALSRLEGDDNRWILVRKGADLLRELDAQNKFEFLNNHE